MTELCRILLTMTYGIPYVPCDGAECIKIFLRLLSKRNNVSIRDALHSRSQCHPRKQIKLAHGAVCSYIFDICNMYIFLRGESVVVLEISGDYLSRSDVCRYRRETRVHPCSGQRWIGPSRYNETKACRCIVWLGRNGKLSAGAGYTRPVLRSLTSGAAPGGSADHTDWPDVSDSERAS